MNFLFRFLAFLIFISSLIIADGAGGAKDQSISLLHKGRHLPILKNESDNSFYIASNFTTTKNRVINIYDANFIILDSIQSPYPSPGDDFGQSMSLNKDFLAIGAPGAYNGKGAVFLFQNINGNWQHILEIANPNNSFINNSFQQFGYDLELNDNYLVVSSPFDDKGKVYVYDFTVDEGFISLKHSLHPHGHGDGHHKIDRMDPERIEQYGFGIDIDLYDNQLLIGSDNNSIFYLDISSIDNNFILSDYEITYDDSHEHHYDHLFGRTVKIGESYLLVSSLGCENGNGKIRLYQKDDLNQYFEITPKNVSNNYHFGFNIEETNDKLFISSFNGTKFYSLDKNSNGVINQNSLYELSYDLDFGSAGRNFLIDGDAIIAGDYYNNRIIKISLSNTNTFTSYQLNTTKINSISDEPCIGGKAGNFDCNNVHLASFMSNSDLNVSTQGGILNDIWGWTDSESEKEYAIVGMSDGTVFVDVSNPFDPIYLGKLPSSAGSNSWRDIKVFSNHAYIVADNTGNHGMQVFDLTSLRNYNGTPTVFVETFLYTGFQKAHNIFINEDTGYAYAVGTETCGPGGLHVIDINTPTLPAYVGCFSDPNTGRSGSGYVHDVQCVVYDGPDQDYQGKEVCFGSNETAVWIVDVTTKVTDLTGANTISLGRYDYGYTHQGWLTEDKKYFIQNDELDEYYGSVSNTRTLIWNVEDLDNPFIENTYVGPTGSIDHNNYVLGDKVYMSHYTSGLRILDISNISSPQEVGYFDVYPPNNSSVFSGTWSNYPYFESGTIVVTSMDEGLFILKESDYGPAMFNIENSDQNYIRSDSDVSITPDFPFGFDVEKYLVAIGSSTIDDILAWTEVSLSTNSTLDLTGLSLQNYSSYNMSLQGIDGDGNSNSIFTKSFNIYTSLLGDYDSNWVLDNTDLNSFVNAWPNVDIGPAVGTAPYLYPNLDQESDINDVNVFSRNWTWSASNRTPQQIQPNGLNPQIDDINILKFGDIITIEIPETIINGVIQIQKKTNDANFSIIENLSEILTLEENSDFYQLTFGNLDKVKSMIRLQANNSENELFIDYKIFSKDNVGSSSILVKDIKDNELYQNYPNPFNSHTAIKFDLIDKQTVDIYIYNIIGELVRKIEVGEVELGQHVIIWDGKSDSDEKVSSGIYFYQLNTNSFTKTKKMTFLNSEN